MRYVGMLCLSEGYRLDIIVLDGHRIPGTLRNVRRQSDQVNDYATLVDLIILF